MEEMLAIKEFLSIIAYKGKRQTSRKDSPVPDVVKAFKTFRELKSKMKYLDDSEVLLALLFSMLSDLDESVKYEAKAALEQMKMIGL